MSRADEQGMQTALGASFQLSLVLVTVTRLVACLPVHSSGLGPKPVFSALAFEFCLSTCSQSLQLCSQTPTQAVTTAAPSTGLAHYLVNTDSQPTAQTFSTLSHLLSLVFILQSTYLHIDIQTYLLCAMWYES